MAKISTVLLLLLYSSFAASANIDKTSPALRKRLFGKSAKSAKFAKNGKSAKSEKSAKSTKSSNILGKADPNTPIKELTKDASELASDLRVMLKMGKNFNQGDDCSMAEWGLCYTQTLTLEYSGDDYYSDE